MFLYSSVRFNVATSASIATLSIVTKPHGRCLDEEVWSSRRGINRRFGGANYILMMFENMTVYGERRLPQMEYHCRGATAMGKLLFTGREFQSVAARSSSRMIEISDKG